MMYNCGDQHQTLNIEILERFQLKVLRIITDAPLYVPNVVIIRDLQVMSVGQEVRNYSVTYWQKLDEPQQPVKISISKTKLQS